MVSIAPRWAAAGAPAAISNGLDSHGASAGAMQVDVSTATTDGELVATGAGQTFKKGFTTLTAATSYEADSADIYSAAPPASAAWKLLHEAASSGACTRSGESPVQIGGGREFRCFGVCVPPTTGEASSAAEFAIAATWASPQSEKASSASVCAATSPQAESSASSAMWHI